MKKLLSILLIAVLAFSFAACGNKDVVDYSESADNALVVAEAGSAGEDTAKTEEFFANSKFTPVDSQAKALMDVKSGTSDIAVVDYVLSIGSIGEGTDYEDLAVVPNKEFAPEQYGIAFRKGSDATKAVNDAIKELMNDGTLDKIASDYKLQELLIKDAEPFEKEYQEGDLKYIQDKGELVIGITYFAPMNYMNENNELTGFETEFAKAVCEKLGVKAKFVEINWKTKEIELNAKNIDCIWNGMTINDERLQNMSISVPYMENKQVMITKTK